MPQVIAILAVSFVLSSGSRSHVIGERRKERVFSYSFCFQRSTDGAQFWNSSIHWPSQMVGPSTKSCYLPLPMSSASWCPFVFLHLPLKLVLDSPCCLPAPNSNVNHRCPEGSRQSQPVVYEERRWAAHYLCRFSDFCPMS